MGIITLDIAAKASVGPSQSGWIKIPVAYGASHAFTIANFTSETTPIYVAEDILNSVKVVSLPINGELQLSTVSVTLNQEITHADITAGNFVYVSDGTITSGYTDGGMSFLVSDQTSLLFNSISNVAAFSVNSNYNLASTSVGDGSGDATLGVPFVFTRASLTSDLDIPYSDPESDAADELLISDVPHFGRLELNGVIQVAGDIVDFTDIDSGLFVYIAETLLKAGEIEEFQFKISDTGSGEFKG